MRGFFLTTLAMVAFAANSVLCRLALRQTHLDAATFTSVRLASGAVVLAIILTVRRGSSAPAGNWGSALALFAYAAAFSFAYRSLSAGTGALLLFGAVQATMILYGLWKGERFVARQTLGFALAIGGLVALVLPGITAPSPKGSVLMLTAGIAWGIYSLRGRGTKDPVATTAGNFLRAAPFALAVSIALHRSANLDRNGLVFAVLSGAIASALGYVLWYSALRALRATTAATVQLSVPPLAAIGGIIFLGETLSLRLVISSIAVLSGIAIFVKRR